MKPAPLVLALALLGGVLLLPGAAQVVPGGPGGGQSGGDKPTPPAGAPPLGAPPSAPDTSGAGAAGASGTGGAGGAGGQAGASGTNGAGGPGSKPEPLPGEERCGWCGTTGKVPFDKNKPVPVEQEHGDTWKVDDCSVAIDSPNEGIPWIPCPHCKTPSLKAIADKEYAALTAANKAWMADRRKADALVKAGKPLAHVQTTHFCITTDVSHITTVDKKSYNTHEIAHLYARRLEDLYQHYQTMFGIKDSQNMRNLHYVYIFEHPEQQVLAAPVYTGLSGLPTVRRSGGAKDISAIVTFWDKAEYPKDEDMYRHQIHECIHQLTSVFWDVSWFKVGEVGLSPPWLNDHYGWLDEGLSHWFEIDFDGIANTYCYREQDAHARWGSADWHKNIFKSVSAGDIPSFSDVMTRSSQALSPKEHQFAWSWVDYLMTKDRLLMGKALKLCKQKTETRDILKQAWGLTIPDFEDQWQKWVLETYAPTTKGR